MAAKTESRPLVSAPAAALRHLMGLSAAELAADLGVDATRVLEAEGGASESAVRDFAERLGLDPDRLLKGVVQPATDESRLLRFFTLRADDGLPQVDAAAVPHLLEALRYGRIWAGYPAPRASLLASRRTVPVDGDNPTAAARQGYHLADRLRRELGLGDQPIDDIVAVAARCNVPVLTRDLGERGLRAAAAVAADRSAAGIVLHTVQPKARWAWRVSVAHELCHVLFDPPGAGRTLVTLDGKHEHETRDLLEARARGFAVELLVPAVGLRRLFGLPDSGAGLTEDGAAARVVAAADRFRCSKPAVRYHLRNRGYLRDEQVSGPRVLESAVPETDVEWPAAGRPPRHWSHIPAPVDPPDDTGAADPLARLAQRKQREVEAALNRMVKSLGEGPGRTGDPGQLGAELEPALARVIQSLRERPGDRGPPDLLLLINRALHAGDRALVNRVASEVRARLEDGRWPEGEWRGLVGVLMGLGRADWVVPGADALAERVRAGLVASRAEPAPEGPAPVAEPAAVVSGLSPSAEGWLARFDSKAGK